MAKEGIEKEDQALHTEEGDSGRNSWEEEHCILSDIGELYEETAEDDNKGASQVHDVISSGVTDTNSLLIPVHVLMYTYRAASVHRYPNLSITLARNSKNYSVFNSCFNNYCHTLQTDAVFTFNMNKHVTTCTNITQHFAMGHIVALPNIGVGP